MRHAWLEKWNPSVKAITIVICGILLALTESWRLNLGIMLICFMALLIASRCRMSTFFKTLAPALIMAGALFWSGIVFGKVPEGAVGSMGISNTVESALLMSTRILAYVGMGMLFALSMDQEEFIVSLMHQCHLKPKFAYGVLAAVHLLPTLQREWQEVQLAYRVRGKKTGLIPMGPLFNTLVNGIRWSENVAMAMESKGFDGDGERTFSVVTTVSADDINFAVICVGAMIAALILGI